jgi:hypothetical protein
VIDGVLDYLAYQRNASGGKLTRETEALEKDALLSSSRIELTEYRSAEPPAPPNPAGAHLPFYTEARLDKIADESFISIGIRPGFHGLLDRQDGFLKNSDLAILETWLTRRSQGAPQLGAVTFVRVANYPNARAYAWPIAWRAELTWAQSELSPQARTGVTSLADVGLSQDLGADLLVYGLLGVEAFTHGSTPRSDLYLGPSVGLLYEVASARLRSTLEFQKQYQQGVNLREEVDSLQLKIAKELTENFSIVFRGQELRPAVGAGTLTRWGLGLGWYF